MESPEVAPVPCSRCRTRRVKCDRRPGGCLRCEKVAEACPGYSRVRRFHDEGPSLRKKLSKTQERVRRNEEPALPPSPLTSSPAQKSPADPGAFGTPPNLGQDALDVDVSPASGVSSADAHGQDLFFDDAYFDLDPDVYYAQEDNLCGFAPGILLAEDVWDKHASVFQGAETPQTSTGTFSETAAGSTLGQETESCPELQLHEALLTRHFVEVISPWLDVFDTDRYFGHTVPVNSLRSRLLRDTILAIAARQIGNKRREAVGEEAASYAELEAREHGVLVDWSYEAAGFYDRAIRGMVTSLQYIDIATGHHEGYLAGGNSNDVDNMLSAVSIFLLYESLDDRHPGIAQHMAGAQHLLQLVLGKTHPLPPAGADTTIPPTVRITQAWRASFWNLASFDYINSYARRSQTRLKFDDVHLWEASGLSMAWVDGQHVPSSLVRHGSAEGMTETMACRTLVWIVLKTLHYVFPSDHGDDAPRFQNETANWHQLEQHLKDWHSALPASFEACIRMPPRPLHETHSSIISVPFPQLFYTSTMGATALLLYHFTRLLVLLNKPPDEPRRQSGLGRLQSHRQFSEQVNHHAGEICGIALGRPQHGAQLHLVQPLCLAGLCLDSEARRVVLADLLVGVQRRTGYSTEWRVVKLREEWGWMGGS